MKKKRDYVTYKDIEAVKEKYKPNYIILYGGRNDGKSFAAKEKVLRDYFRDGFMFCYLRRYDADIKAVDNLDYWADFTTGEPNKIQELSGGRYNALLYEKGKIFVGTAAEGKTTQGPQIGYVHALAIEQRYKSLQFPLVNTVIYEEFCTSGTYLYNEVNRFMNYISTIARDREIDVLLIGNTISRQNAFFREWQLTGIANQQPGSVDLYRFKTDEGEVKVAAYYTYTLKSNSMFFGSSARMITGGQWEAQEQPRLPGEESDYTEIYRLSFETDQLNRFLMRFMVKDENGIWYVTKRTSDFKPDERVISPHMILSPLYTANFTAINDAERTLFKYLSMGRICYSDNLTGTEFKRALKQLHIINAGE